MEKNKSDQILTISLDRPTLWNALEECLRIGAEGDLGTVEVLFGWAWGNEYEDWKVLELPWSDVMARVQDVEQRGFGSIGEDDLWLTIGEDEYLFCHEADIHFPAEAITKTGKRMCEYLRTLEINSSSFPRI